VKLANKGPFPRLLLINLSAGSVTPEVVTRIRKELDGFHFVEYHKRLKIGELLSSRARVVVAGGDGAVGTVAQQLLHTPHTLGILPAGTYNNFAAGIGIPADLDAALELVKRGRAGTVSVGRANGEAFLEAAMVGLFGEALLAGEAAKDFELGDLVERLKAVATAPKFEFTLSGDLVGRGTARSLFFANTPRIGAHIKVAEGTPMDSRLEFSLADALLKFKKLRVHTSPRVRLFADARPIGRTPASIEIDQSALRVLLPVTKARAREG
jgi:diacylglycerol kinase family enzyme